MQQRVVEAFHCHDRGMIFSRQHYLSLNVSVAFKTYLHQQSKSMQFHLLLSVFYGIGFTVSCASNAACTYHIKKTYNTDMSMYFTLMQESAIASFLSACSAIFFFALVFVSECQGPFCCSLLSLQQLLPTCLGASTLIISYIR